MEYILILLIFILNYFLWKKPFNVYFHKLNRCNLVLKIIINLTILSWIPYALSLILLVTLNLKSNVLSNVMIVFCLQYIAFVTYKELAEEQKTLNDNG